MIKRVFVGWCLLVLATCGIIFGAYLAGIAMCGNGCANDAIGTTSAAVIVASIVWGIIAGNLIW